MSTAGVDVFFLLPAFTASPPPPFSSPSFFSDPSPPSVRPRVALSPPPTAPRPRGPGAMGRGAVGMRGGGAEGGGGGRGGAGNGGQRINLRGGRWFVTSLRHSWNSAHPDNVSEVWTCPIVSMGGGSLIAISSRSGRPLHGSQLPNHAKVPPVASFSDSQGRPWYANSQHCKQWAVSRHSGL